jgi:hypothetical protein
MHLVGRPNVGYCIDVIHIELSYLVFILSDINMGPVHETFVMYHFKPVLSL